MRRKRLFGIILPLLLPAFLFAQTVQKDTKVFAVKDGRELKMDIYCDADSTQQAQPCLVFVFGGGFKEGTRDAKLYTDYFNYFAKRGFTVASIDYRLGMKGQKAPSILNQKPLRRAIAMAVEDLFSATNYLLKNAGELRIDPAQIIISGSSAGAMTVLQADYERSNGFASAQVLPPSFRYAGVIAFAGSIYSREGAPDYKTKPAPTLFFHGDVDKLVPFKSVRLFNVGVFGSESIAKQFTKYGFPFTFYIMEKNGHNVSEYPMVDFLPEIEEFIRDLVIGRKQWQIEIEFYDKFRESDTSTNPGNYYN